METNNTPKPYAASLINEVAAEVAENIRRTGIVRCDLEELSALKEGAKARVRTMAAPSFGQHIDSDRELALSLKATKERTDRLRTKGDVLNTRLTNAQEQTERTPTPGKAIAGIITTAIGVFTLCFAPTIYSVFLSSMEDALLGWVVSIILGAAMGGFLTLLLVNSEGDGTAMRSAKWFGFALGIGAGLMRAAKADSPEGFVIAGGLTLIECAAVAGLDWFAQKRRQVASAHRISQSQIVALEQAVTTVHSQMTEEDGRYERLLGQLKQREAEAFDVARVAEDAAAAVEAAYRSAISANQRLLEGGALEPLSASPGDRGRL